MKLYIQDENYHFDGFLSGVIIDKNRTAIFKKDGVQEHYLDINLQELNWYDLHSFEMINNTVKIKAKNFVFYKEFYCLNIIELPS
ncbi:MAG: hypothetical protein KA157_11260 [Aliarcobacter sp.]|jgi:hypothetical protein|nr:hypothetical protein [Aliarcobacter sp.]